MTLSLAQQEWLVDAWACKFRGKQIVERFQEEWQESISYGQVYSYNLDRVDRRIPNDDGRYPVHPKLIERFDRKRAEFLALQQEFDPLYTKLGRVETKVQRHHYLTEKLHAETITIQEIRELGTLENEIADELGQKSSTKFDISKVSTEALLELLNADSKGEDTD